MRSRLRKGKPSRSEFRRAGVGWALAILAAIVAIVACAGPKPASVTRVNPAGESTLPLTLTGATGVREDYTLNATVVFVSDPAPRDTLSLHVEVEIAVPSRFVAGRFRLREGDTVREGSVTSTALNFRGGQGGDPSLGGVFEFRTGPKERYVVYLPPTDVARPE